MAEHKATVKEPEMTPEEKAAKVKHDFEEKVTKEINDFFKNYSTIEREDIMRHIMAGVEVVRMAATPAVEGKS